MSFVWSQEAVELLNRLYVQEGLSAARTAEALQRALGGAPTRNAVLGKAQRLGWCKPEAPKPERAPKPRAEPRRVARWRPPAPAIPMPVLREIPPTVPPKLWTDRQPGECAYPVGEAAAPGQQLCCGAPTGGGAYCPPHRGLMTQPMSALTPEDLAAILAIARRAA